MKLTNKAVALQCLERIEQTQKLIEQLDDIQSYLIVRKRWEDPDAGNLRQLLIERELDEWRDFMMWGLTLEPDEQARVKAAAYHRFLREGMSVASWLNDGVMPGSWFEADEKEFRELARKAFGGRNEST